MACLAAIRLNHVEDATFAAPQLSRLLIGRVGFSKGALRLSSEVFLKVGVVRLPYQDVFVGRN
jgi:hypothetical protein